MELWDQVGRSLRLLSPVVDVVADAGCSKNKHGNDDGLLPLAITRVLVDVDLGGSGDLVEDVLEGHLEISMNKFLRRTYRELALLSS